MQREFVFVKFSRTPFSQPFRYNKKWWVRSRRFHDAGLMLEKFVDNVDEDKAQSLGLIKIGCNIILNKNTIVATENTIITKIYESQNEER